MSVITFPSICVIEPHELSTETKAFGWGTIAAIGTGFMALLRSWYKRKTAGDELAGKYLDRLIALETWRTNAELAAEARNTKLKEVDEELGALKEKLARVEKQNIEQAEAMEVQAAEVETLKGRIASLELEKNRLMFERDFYRQQLKEHGVEFVELPTVFQSPKQPSTVLVIDDDTDFCGAAFAWFTRLKYEVRTAHNLADAIAAIEYSIPDAILLDIRLGSENGIDVLRHITSHAIKTRVFVLTGEPDERLKDVLALKPEGMMLKPIDFRSLTDEIAGSNRSVKIVPPVK